jgi:CRISPR system Cascade subunit CasD
MTTLAFYIDAPLQSWGDSSKFQHRETNSFPTKSALIGVIAAALGIDKHQANEATELQPLVDLRLTVVKLGNDKLPLSRFTDFHTIGGGYDKKAPLWEKMSIPRKASGAPFGTVITHRSYLTDAAFVALLEGESDILNQVQAALENPVWGIWFGRKTCLPASPLSPHIGNSRQAALDALLAFLPRQTPAPLETFEYQEETKPDATSDGTFYQSDQPIAFGKHHGAVPAAYRARGIRQHRPKKTE